MNENAIDLLIEKNLELMFEHLNNIPADSIEDNGDTRRILHLLEGQYHK